MSIKTLHEFDERERIVEEMKRALKKGGKALIINFKKENTSFGPTVAIRVSKEEAIILFKKKEFFHYKERKPTVLLFAGFFEERIQMNPYPCSYQGGR